jgi:hypothetical protein
MARPRKSRRSNRTQGFSGPGQRQAWNVVTQSIGMKGREKRQFFNQISGVMVMSAAVVGALVGYSTLGWIGAILGLVVAAGLMAKFVIRGRYYR